MALSTGREKIVLFGDSITQRSFSVSECGWGAYLADRYQRRVDVLNRGFSGYNSDWFLRYAATDDGKEDLFGRGEGEGVKLVTIFFGANDASDPTLNARQHIPLDRFKSNIQEIASLIRKNFGAEAKIIVMSPPPVDHEGRLKFQKEQYKEKATGKLERTLERSGEYSLAAKEAAKELNVPFLDLWTNMQFTSSKVEKPWRNYLCDGLHLSSEGNKFVGDALMGLIDEEFPELAVKGVPETGGANSASSSFLKRAGPWHDEIDYTQPEKAFPTT